MIEYCLALAETLGLYHPFFRPFQENPVDPVYLEKFESTNQTVLSVR